MCTTYLEDIAKIVGSAVYIRRPGRGMYSIHLADPKKQQEVARFSLQQLPGCCGVCVSFHAAVSEPYRKKGLGSLLNLMRQQIAWGDNYTVLLCTDVAKNVAQQKVLLKNEWQNLLTFKNRRTKNDVCLHVKVLKDTGKKVGGEKIDLSPAKD